MDRVDVPIASRARCRILFGFQVLAPTLVPRVGIRSVCTCPEELGEHEREDGSHTGLVKSV